MPAAHGGQTIFHKVVAASRIVPDTADVRELPTLLFRLARLARERYLPTPGGFDPAVQMAVYSDDTTGNAEYVGVGVSTLDTVESRWEQACAKANDTDAAVPSTATARNARMRAPVSRTERVGSVTTNERMRDSSGAPAAACRWSSSSFTAWSTRLAERMACSSSASMTTTEITGPEVAWLMPAVSSMKRSDFFVQQVTGLASPLP